MSLQDFDLGRVVGIGLMGRVYCAQHRASKKYYVLKSLSKAEIARKNMFRYLSSEKEAYEELQHPSIVRYFGTFQSENQVHFILEYIPGGELFTWYTSLNVVDRSFTGYSFAEPRCV
jgi:serine/threonine protein kinase